MTNSSLGPLAHMTLDHCKAFDHLLSDQGGICAPTITCCFYVNTSGQIEKSTSQLPEKTTGKQRQISYDITYTWNLKKQYKWTYLPKRNNRVTDVENELMFTREGGMKGQIGRLGLTYINYYISIHLFATPWTAAHQAPLPMGILQARIPEWVAMPSSSGSSQPRDPTQVSFTAGRFFTVWATTEVYIK